MTTKQRAYLKGLAMNIDTIFQIGKSGLSEETTKQLSNALEARELIKIKVLDTCPMTAKELSEIVAQNTGAACVQVIGCKVILINAQRKNKKSHCRRHDEISLPFRNFRRHLLTGTQRPCRGSKGVYRERLDR